MKELLSSSLRVGLCAALMGAFLWVAGGGCTGPGVNPNNNNNNNNNNKVCVVGAFQPCTCPGGQKSSQSCAPDGLSWGVCLCSNPVDGGGPRDQGGPGPDLNQPLPDSKNPVGDKGSTGGDKGSTGGDKGNTGGDKGSTGGDKGSTGGDKSGGVKDGVVVDGGIVVPDEPPPTPPAGSAFFPELLNVATFWRFMPGSVYRPIVVTAIITVENKGKVPLTEIKVDAKVYLYNSITSKYIPLDILTPALPASVPVGFKKNIEFNGSTMDHGLPRYQSPAEICGKYYVPVIRFQYKEGGASKSFRMMWRRVPFGCNCFGSEKCP